MTTSLARIVRPSRAVGKAIGPLSPRYVVSGCAVERDDGGTNTPEAIAKAVKAAKDSVAAGAAPWKPSSGGARPPPRDDWAQTPGPDDYWITQSLLIAAQIRVDPCAQTVGRAMTYCRSGEGTPGGGLDALGEGIHTALDVAGLVPGVGAVPDLINAAF